MDEHIVDATINTYQQEFEDGFITAVFQLSRLLHWKIIRRAVMRTLEQMDG